MQSNDIADEDVVRLILQGDTELYAEILRRYRTKVAGMVYHMTGSHADTEDIAQDVFIAAYKNLKVFEYRSRFSTWLYRITVNKCRDWQRRQQTRSPARLIEIWRDRASPPAERVAERAEVRDAVRELPEKYRTVIILYYFHDLPCQEIAETLDIPRKTIETQLARGRTMLARKLDPGGETAWNKMNGG
ncbi:MAG: RNA polymerase sigma factor [Solirubrobacterales bacterium]